MNLNSIKRFAAQALDIFGLNTLGHFIQCKTLFPFIRVVNYHDIPQTHADNFEDQLRFYSNRFVNVDKKMLTDFLDTGQWGHDRPGLIISFDDGLRSHYEVAAKLLERHGFIGWFFVPSRWIADARFDVATDEFAGLKSSDVCLTLDQLKYLAEHHVVGCHTRTHTRLSKELSAEKLNKEIVLAKKDLTEMLGQNIDIFCWVGGEEFTYSREAAELIRQNYDLSFMTNSEAVRPNTHPLQLQRTNIEAPDSLPLVRFQTSGLMDVIYAAKRKRVNALTR